MLSEMNFTNKVVVITGAASGIGAATAISFAKLNAILCIVDINEKNLRKIEEACAEITKSSVLTVVADVSKEEEVKNIVDTARKDLGKIDVLVNCAGIWRRGGIQDADIVETFDTIISVNLRPIIAITKHALPALIESKGCIINISSVTALIEIKDALAYSISKAGVTKFTKCVALDLARHGVRVNCISPGPVKTNLLLNSGINEAENEKAWNNCKESVPLKTYVKPEEIAELAVYLASDKASSVTGSDFFVDAGMKLGNYSDVSES